MAALQPRKSKSFCINDEKPHNYTQGRSSENIIDCSSNGRERLNHHNASGKSSANNMPSKRSRSFHLDVKEDYRVVRGSSDNNVAPSQDRTDVDLSLNLSNDWNRLNHLVHKLINAGITHEELSVRSARSQTSGNSINGTAAGASTLPSGQQQNKVDELANRLIYFKKAVNSTSAGTSVSRDNRVGRKKYSKNLTGGTADTSSNQTPQTELRRHHGGLDSSLTGSAVTSAGNSDQALRRHHYSGLVDTDTHHAPSFSLDKNHNKGSGSHNNDSMKFKKPPPPPPPPRRSNSSPCCPQREVINLTAALTNIRKPPPAAAATSVNNNDSVAINSNMGNNRSSNSEQRSRSFGQRRSGDGDRGEMMAKLSKSCDTSKGKQASFHKGSTKNDGIIKIDKKKKKSNQVLDVLSKSNLVASFNEAEAYDFEEICSPSLPELMESPSPHPMSNGHNDNMKSIINSNNKNNNSNSLASHEFSKSSMTFNPRPVRVSQFEDTDEPDDPSATSKRRSKAVTTTTFSNSIRQHENSGANSMNMSPVGVGGGTTDSFRTVSHYKTTNSINKSPLTSSTTIASNYKATSSPSNAKTPSSARSHIDSLPDNVDKKGRCIRHPNIKLFKKKILGGYELIRAYCPKCEEEAPYESLWRERAQVNQRVSKDLQSTGSEGKPSQGQRASKERKSSRSKERRARSKERRGDELEDIASSFPHVPSLLHHGEAHEEEIARGGSGSSAIHPPPPSSAQEWGVPPPPFHQANHHRSPPPPPRRIRKYSSERAGSNSRGRERAQSSVPVTPETSPSITDEVSAPDSKSLFDKGIGKFSSLQKRARSLSNRRNSAPPVHEESKRASSRNGMCNTREGGIPSSIDRHRGRSPNNRWRSPHSNNRGRSPYKVIPTKKNFDKKTGRCRDHPSILLARKSKFSKGWDIIRDCPLCIEHNKSNDKTPINNGMGTGDDQEKFEEISTQKMNALLCGNSNLSGVNCQQPSDPINNNSFMGGHSSARMAPRKTANNKTNKPNNEMTKASGRYSKPDTPEDMDDLHPGHEAPLVKRMPYITPWGESGWYTGEVDYSGKPHGQGRLRSKTGNQIEGEWTNGNCIEHLEKQGRMKSGFGSNVAKWKEKDHNVDAAAVRNFSSERRGRSLSGSGQMLSNTTSSHSIPQYQGQYPAAYHSLPYGTVPANTKQPAVGMWNQQSPGYQCYPNQSPHQSPGGRSTRPPPPYRPGYHQ